MPGAGRHGHVELAWFKGRRTGAMTGLTQPLPTGDTVDLEAGKLFRLPRQPDVRVVHYALHHLAERDDLLQRCHDPRHQPSQGDQ